MAWFEYLRDSGFFNASKNPRPRTDAHGRDVYPTWEAIQYLENLSNSFERGEMLSYVPEVLKIIRNISDDPVDNFFTWHSILIILGRIPNELVPLDILEYLPVWTASNTNSSLVNNTILEVLLPKFLNVAGNIIDRAKASVILNCIFTLQRSSPEKDSQNYYSCFDDYFVIEAFVKNKLIEKVATNFSLDDIRKLPDAVGYLLRDHISRPTFGVPETQYRLTGRSVYEQLHLSLEELGQDGEFTTVFGEVIDGYLDNGRAWQDSYFTDIFTKFNPAGESTSDILARATFMLRKDFNSELNLEPISDLEKDAGLDPELTMNALILREWLVYLAINDPEKACIEIKFLLEAARFDLTYFKRIILFAIAANWKALKGTFWDMVGADHEKQLFSIDTYKVDLAELLTKVSSDLDDEDSYRLKKIFIQGPVGDRHYAPSADYWRLRWLDALKEHPEFSEDHKTTKSLFQTQPDFANEGRVVIRSGYSSPIESEELGSMSVKDIVARIESFVTEDDWNGPDVEGFANALGTIVEKEPAMFIEEIDKFDKISFPYVYNLLFGFMQAFRRSVDIDLTPIVEFCDRYMSAQEFWDGSLLLPGRPGTKREWIYGQIADLISEAAKQQQDQLGEKRSKLLKKMVLKMTSLLEATDRLRFKEGMDYLMYALNSTQGKVLRCLLDVSLQDKRLRTDKNTSWDEDLKKAFENALSSDILESYTVEAMFLPQLIFLDEPWLQQQLKINYDLTDEKWLAFMGGIAFKSPPINTIYFPLMLPHYERAVNNRQIDIHHEGGILRHLLAIYFQKDDINWERSLLFQAMSGDDPQFVERLIMLVNQQRQPIKNLDLANKARILKKVFVLWSFVLAKVKQVQPHKENAFRPIFRFIEYVEAEMLNEETTEMIIETVKFAKNYGLNFLFKELLRFSNGRASAKHIGRMLTEFEFNYFYEKDKLVMLLEYLYNSGEKEQTNAFVGRLAQDGYDFLRPVYLKYNS